MIKCFVGRSQLLGDSISSLPLLHLAKKRYPNSYITWPIAKKSQSTIQFIKNHPLINEILISDDDEGNIYTIDGVQYNQKTDKLPGFDFQIDCNPPARANWYNNDKNRLVNENCLMAGFIQEEFDNLNDQEKIPKLYRYFDLKYFSTPKVPVITFQSTAGYGQGLTRSPSVDWWNNLIESCQNRFCFVQIGHPNDAIVRKAGNICHHDFIEQFAYILGSSLYIGIENGITWIVGAYGEIPQINLTTYHMPNHSSNPIAWMPQSQRQDETNFFHPYSCSDISIEEVVKAIEKYKFLPKNNLT